MKTGPRLAALFALLVSWLNSRLDSLVVAMKAVLNVETYLHCSQDLRGTQHGLWPGQGKFVLTGRRRSLRFSRGWGISPRCCPVVFDPSADQRVFDSHSFARRRRVFILRRSDSSAGSGSFSEHTSGDVTSARVLAHAQIVEHHEAGQDLA